MAVGDVKSDEQTVTAGNFLDIIPGSGEQWSIHNIWHAADIEIYYHKTTGPLDCFFDAAIGKGIHAYYVFELTPTLYIRVKNVSASSQVIGYSGRQI